MKIDRKKKGKESIGLVLGSGAARGLSHIGVLKAIEELGIKIDYICGCSIGALIGGAYAAGMPIREIEKIARQTNWKLMAKIFSPSLSLSAFLNDKYLMEFLNTYFEGVSFESLNIPFSAVATEIESGEMVVIEKGDLVSAIRASASVPLLFSPVQFGRHKLVDGGLINPTPVDVVSGKGYDKIIAVNLRGFKPAKFFTEINEISAPPTDLGSLSLNEKIEYFMRHPREFFLPSKNGGKMNNPKFGSVLYQMFIIVQTQMAELNLKNNPPDILIQPETSDFKMFDFNKADALIKIGYEEAMKQLPTESL